MDHPEQFPLAAATAHPTTSELVVTGTVTPDVSRNVPVVSLASGRVVAIHARLGDTVQEGPVVADCSQRRCGGRLRRLSQGRRRRASRAQAVESSQGPVCSTAPLLSKTWRSRKTPQMTPRSTLETATEHLRLLGNDPDKPKGMVDIFAPVTGVITDQQVTNAARVQAYSAPKPVHDFRSLVRLGCLRRVRK